MPFCQCTPPERIAFPEAVIGATMHEGDILTMLNNARFPVAFARAEEFGRIAARPRWPSTGNLKPVWSEPIPRDWLSAQGQAPALRDNAVQVKSVWLP